MIRIRKAMLYGAGDLRLDEQSFDPTALVADQVLVKTELSGFSTGTDLGNYLGRSTEVPGAPDYPRGVGYSNVGRVLQTGSSVTAVKPGDRVFSIKPHCSAFVAGPSDLLIPVPDAVPSDQASLGYLINLGVAALRQVRYDAGEHVCVIGLGVIGLCTVAVARTMGAQVTVVANDQARAELAQRLGAARGTPAANSVDIVVLTANTWDAYRTSVDLARRGGRLSILGFPGRAQDPPSFNPLDPSWFYGKQLTLVGAGFLPRVDCGPDEVRFNLRRNMIAIFEWIAAGVLDVGPVISHRIPFDRMRDAYELARAHDKSLTAAVFDWSEA